MCIAAQVTYLAWNCKVQHILASTSVKGTTIVWDLKRQKPVISFTDPNRCDGAACRPCTDAFVARICDVTLRFCHSRAAIGAARLCNGTPRCVRHAACYPSDSILRGCLCLLVTAVAHHAAAGVSCRAHSFQPCRFANSLRLRRSLSWLRTMTARRPFRCAQSAQPRRSRASLVKAVAQN